jgi:anaerobic ribonucleoside-triphosphate reductase activating protein
MRYKSFQLTFQEVPTEISLCFLIAGCPLRCKGCHSVDAWKRDQGQELNLKVYENILQKYIGIATCVCFLGGEWHEDGLIEFLKLAQKYQFKTCLYTGLDDVSTELKAQLDFIKTGNFKAELGGLNSIQTNQKFIHLASGKLLNHLFIKEGATHDTNVRRAN